MSWVFGELHFRGCVKNGKRGFDSGKFWQVLSVFGQLIDYGNL